MTSLLTLTRFFDERISSVNGNTKPLLQKLKKICEKRASGSISEQQALFELEKVSGVKTMAGAFNILPGQFNTNMKPVVNPFAGVRTNNVKQKAIFSGLFDYDNKPRVEQFPVLGLKPIQSNGNKKRFVVSPQARTWFDSKNFKKPVPIIKQVKVNRFNENNVALKNIVNTAKQSIGPQPVLKGWGMNNNPRQGKRNFKRNDKSVVGMMGWNK